jgi:hypothetical protein
MVRGVFVSWAGRLCQLGLCVSCVYAVLGSLTAQKLWGVPTPTGHGCSMATSLHEADDTQAACPPQPPLILMHFVTRTHALHRQFPVSLGITEVAAAHLLRVHLHRWAVPIGVEPCWLRARGRGRGRRRR